MILFIIIYLSKEVCKNPDITKPSQLVLFFNIKNREYADCTQIKGQLTIPANCDQIGDESFYNCTGLYGSLIFEHDVTKIGHNAFLNTNFDRIIYKGTKDSDCTNDSFPEDIPIYVSDSYQSDSLCDHNVTIADINDLINNPIPDMTPEATDIIEPTETIEPTDSNTCQHLEVINTDQLILESSIDEKEFAQCSQIIGRLKLPPTLKSIGDSAFLNCNGIFGSLEIPSGVEYISNNAFDGCTSLNESLIIRSDLNEIGSEAFRSTHFTNIFFYGKKEPICGENVFPSHQIINVNEEYKDKSFCGNKISFIIDETPTNSISEIDQSYDSPTEITSTESFISETYILVNTETSIPSESPYKYRNPVKSKKMSSGAVVGIIIGCVVFVIGVVALLIYLFSIRKRRGFEQDDDLSSNALAKKS